MKEPTLEDMCKCKHTLPLRARLNKINDLFQFYQSLKEKKTPTVNYYSLLISLEEDIVWECDLYERIAEKQLRMGQALVAYKGKVCCADCKTEIALPDSSIDKSFVYTEKQINEDTILN